MLPNVIDTSKGQNKTEFGVKEGLLIKKVPSEEMGDLIVPQIRLACWTRLSF